jgi:rubrerythrin
MSMNEIQVFNADPDRVVSVQVREIQVVLRAVADIANLDGRELVDATVRERTCHNVHGHERYMFECSECGLDIDSDGVPSYCPGCGARVIDGG